MAPNEPEGFPHGVYGKYKRATQFFLDWLLRARGHGLGSGVTPSSSGRVTLDSFHAVVNAIAAAPPSQLSPVLLHQLPRALAACQSAITLRERVAQFFTSNRKSSSAVQEDSHAHFLNRLKAWMAILKRVEGATLPAKSKSSKSKKTTTTSGGNAVVVDDLGDLSRFTNYYEVLRVPDDFFPESVDADTSSSTSSEQSAASVAAPVVSAAERKQLFDAAFEEDLQMELVCFMIEMEDMVEQVYATYREVKHETRTLVEATAVAYAAIQFTQSRVAALQLRYPSITQAEDVITLLEPRIPKELTLKLVDVLAPALVSRKAEHIPGLFLAEFVWVVSALKSFTSAIPSDKKSSLILRDRHFGDNYDEEFTPHYVAPDAGNYMTFLMQQLPLLYNTLVVNKAAGIPRDPNSLPECFFTLLTQFFDSQRVSVPLVFVCICWIKSALALQGSGGLIRNVSLAVARSREVETRLSDSVVKGEVRRLDRNLHQSMEAAVRGLESQRRGNRQGSCWRLLLQANPLLAGFTMLHDQVRLLQIGSEVVLVTTRLQAFLHLYSALVDRRLLQRVPFFEEVLEVYGKAMFTPTRAAASHGSYSRVYLLSSGMTAAAVDAMFRGASLPAKHKAAKARDAYHLRDVSPTTRLIAEQDLSVLANSSESVSLKDGLVRVADHCASEVLKTRVLSRDLLKLNDDLTDLFHALCDGLGRRSFYERLMGAQEPGIPRQDVVNRALEDAVMMPLMLFLDCLNVDGSVDASKLLRSETVTTSGVSDDGISAFCRRAAGIITRRFVDQDAATIESTYFILPKYRDVLSRKFGSRDFKAKTNNRKREEHFCMLMDMLEDCGGKLTDQEVRKLKETIQKDPEIMLQVSCLDELSTVLHHVAAGPARDPALLEWFLQMGALHWQPAGHFRREPADALSRLHSLIDRLAIHSAADAGCIDAVLMILEADNRRDLNTPTYKTKETLVHLAVKNGHRELYNLLVALGADVRQRDAAGNSVSDLTSDVEWKREIVRKIVEQERIHSVIHPKNREAQFRHQGELSEERLRKSIANQREEERVGQSSFTSGTARQAASSSTTGTNAAAAAASSDGEASYKKKSKKNKKKSKAKTMEDSKMPAAGAAPSFSDSSSPSSSTDNATSLLQDLRVGSTSLPSGLAEEMQGHMDAFRQSTSILRTAFEMLKHLQGAPTSEEQQVVAQAVDTLSRLQEIIGYIRRPDQLRTMPREARLVFATNAYDAINLMNKFDRTTHTQTAAIPPQSEASDVEKLRQMCLMQDYFLGFLVGTAQIFESLDRKTQARELLDVAEKRLLKLQDRPADKFRLWVKYYSNTRKACGLGMASNAQVLAELDPYINDVAHALARQAVSSASLTTGGRPQDTLTRLLQDLRLMSTSLGPELVSEIDSQVDSIRSYKASLTSAFEALRNADATPTPQQRQSAGTAVNSIARLQKFLQLIRLQDARQAVRHNARLEFATAAHHAIKLMNQFDRTSQTKVASGSAPVNASNMEKLRHLCLVQDDFVHFLSTTASILASCGSKPQARELLDILEGRLLALQQRPVHKFRPWVKLYSKTRKDCSFGETSGREANRKLHFYIHDIVRNDPEHLLELDGLYGHRGFFAITCKDDERAFKRFCKAFRKYPGTENMLLFSGQVIYACDTSDELRTVLQAHMAAAKETGVDWINESFMSREPTIQIDRYEFSQTGIELVGQ